MLTSEKWGWAQYQLSRIGTILGDSDLEDEDDWEDDIEVTSLSENFHHEELPEEAGEATTIKQQTSTLTITTEESWIPTSKQENEDGQADLNISKETVKDITNSVNIEDEEDDTKSFSFSTRSPVIHEEDKPESQVLSTNAPNMEGRVQEEHRAPTISQPELVTKKKTTHPTTMRETTEKKTTHPTTMRETTEKKTTHLTTKRETTPSIPSTADRVYSKTMRKDHMEEERTALPPSDPEVFRTDRGDMGSLRSNEHEEPNLTEGMLEKKESQTSLQKGNLSQCACPVLPGPQGPKVSNI
ncbi:uncharacterized protein LOC142312775 [Anomaloglossus baeobatrachus]|uniref:uncharacterized protein LOC142312775 n=1 Tax=Anomaloglossus baeobatrachus TaxID=238106 RepID=UPI003F4FE741